MENKRKRLKYTMNRLLFFLKEQEFQELQSLSHHLLIAA